MWSSNFTSGYIHFKKWRDYIKQIICSPMFTALSTIPQTWKQRKCPTMEEWVESMWGIYRQTCMSHTHIHTHTRMTQPSKGGNYASCNNMDEPNWHSVQFSSVAQSCLALCNPMDCRIPGFPVHHQLPEFTQTHAQWCHPTISSSVVPFSSRLQSFPASQSFQRSQLFTSGGQSIGVSALASVISMNIQDWSPLGWSGEISLQSKGLSRVFNTSFRKHSALSFLYSPTLTSIHDHWKNHSLD